MRPTAQGAPRAIDDTQMERGELDAILGFHLREAWLEMERCFSDCFRDEKINPCHYAILTLVAANPGCRPTDLCKVVTVSPTNIVPYLDDLVQRGCLSREIGVSDRRIKVLTLTSRGRDYLARLRELHTRIDRHVADRLGPEERGELIRLLARMTAG